MGLGRSFHQVSPIVFVYEWISESSRSKKPKIVATRHLLRAIYYMIKREQTYDEYIIQ